MPVSSVGDRRTFTAGGGIRDEVARLRKGLWSWGKGSEQ